KAVFLSDKKKGMIISRGYRLKLQCKSQLSTEQLISPSVCDSVSVPRELKLRNYTPEDDELKVRKVPTAKPASVEEKVKDQLEAANPEPIIEEVDLANLGFKAGCRKETGEVGKENAEGDCRAHPSVSSLSPCLSLPQSLQMAAEIIA
uniref:Uncharacterized protein n=1 Tax=Oryzias sinensis TaxID=183150 RepID=A0A8C7X4J3_9TELE